MCRRPCRLGGLTSPSTGTSTIATHATPPHCVVRCPGTQCPGKRTRIASNRNRIAQPARKEARARLGSSIYTSAAAAGAGASDRARDAPVYLYEALLLCTKTGGPRARSRGSVCKSRSCVYVRVCAESRSVRIWIGWGGLVGWRGGWWCIVPSLPRWSTGPADRLALAAPPQYARNPGVAATHAPLQAWPRVQNATREAEADVDAVRAGRQVRTPTS